MQRPGNRNPAPISQRRNNQPTRRPKILIPIRQLNLHLSRDNILIEIIKPQLLDPLEVWDTLTPLETLNNVSEVHVLGDEGDEEFAL